jgi:trans-2-enoyl-CoA reductase
MQRRRAAAAGILRRAVAQAAAARRPRPCFEHAPARALASSASSAASASASSSALAAVFDAFGEPADVLGVREMPLPDKALEDGQVLLELEAVRSGPTDARLQSRRSEPSNAPPPRSPSPPSPPKPNQQAPINPSDVNTIQGRYPLRPEPPSAVPGHEGVFRVVEVGGSSANARPATTAAPPLRPGDRVVPLQPALGTWRSRGVFNARDWHRVPDALPLAAAAMLCINPPTALGLLEGFVDLSSSSGGGNGNPSPSVIAQTGATSAVGQLVVQLTRHRGLKTINLVRADRPDWDDTKQWLERLGADVVTTDTRARHDVQSLGLPPASLALDCVGGASSAAVARLLRKGGTLVSYGAMSMQPVTVPASLLIFKDVRVRGFWLSGGGGGGKEEDETARRRRAAVLDRAAALFLEGAWRAPQAECVPLREAASRGVARAREGRTRTKVLLVPD